MYFQEFDCLAAYQLALFAVGICIMFAGLYVLSVESAKVAKTGRGTLSSRDLTSGTRHGAVSGLGLELGLALGLALALG